MAWRLAKSLVQLRSEFDAAYPGRSKRSDGTIGDAAHRNRASRHNPNRYDVVCALDITHDPASGCDVHRIAREHVRDPHPELAYVISNGQVASRSRGFRWVTYTGSNPHTLHAHFAVGVGPDSDPMPPYDSTQPWGIHQGDVTMLQPCKYDDRDTAAVEALQTYLRYTLGIDIGTWGPAKDGVDLHFGGDTAKGLAKALGKSGEQKTFGVRQWATLMKRHHTGGAAPDLSGYLKTSDADAKYAPKHSHPYAPKHDHPYAPKHGHPYVPLDGEMPDHEHTQVIFR
jgi:hypothetical protein